MVDQVGGFVGPFMPPVGVVGDTRGPIGGDPETVNGVTVENGQKTTVSLGDCCGGGGLGLLSGGGGVFGGKVTAGQGHSGAWVTFVEAVSSLLRFSGAVTEIPLKVSFPVGFNEQHGPAFMS